ncbi:MAG: ABC transporter C-terminal domain-containing protein, partial [Elusimicrobiota bacterium]
PEQAKPGRGPDPKEERKRIRREAQLREGLEVLHARLEELAAKLADPELYADYEKVQAVGTEMESVQAGIQAAEAELGG